MLVTQQVQSLIVGVPGFGDKFSPVSVKENSAVQRCKLRIRTTRMSDISDVSDILATSLLDPLCEFDRGLNFKFKMELLKTKAAVEKMVTSRVNAIGTGLSIDKNCPLQLSATDKLRFLWSNDGFRNKMEKAVGVSTEPYIWNYHNFACAPENPCWLQHKMFTAENSDNGEIVGFCEIAMLSQPIERAGGDEEQCSVEVSPTIINLAISPNHRRRGIASRLMKVSIPKLFCHDIPSTNEVV